MNISEELKLLFDASELNSALHGSFQEYDPGVRESHHQVKEVLLLEAVSVGSAVNRRLVALRGS